MPTTAKSRGFARGQGPAAVHEEGSVQSGLGMSTGESLSKLSEQVYERMKEDIVTGSLGPGVAATEKDLAARYEVSRTPVREAAARLQHQGLIRIVANRGYFVTQLTIRGIREIYEYRAAIECACAELAASIPLRPDSFDNLNRLIRPRRHSDTRSAYAAFIKADTAFHVGIARLTQNHLFVRSVADMRCHMERILFAAIDIVDQNYYEELPAHEHAHILRAIQEHEPELARKRMYDHIVLAKNPVIEQASRGTRFI